MFIIKIVMVLCQFKKLHPYTTARTWTCYNKYIHHRGFMNSGTTSTELNDMLTDFVNYVDSFYGVNDPLYPMINQETKQPLSKVDILGATEKYLSLCSYYEQQDKNWTSDFKVMVWGDGDSLDRERVRDILLEEYNYKFVGE